MNNTVVESCTVENINVALYPGDTFKELSGVTATYKSNDRADGTDVERELNGTYLETALTGAPTAIIASPTVTPLTIHP